MNRSVVVLITSLLGGASLASADDKLAVEQIEVTKPLAKGIKVKGTKIVQVRRWTSPDKTPAWVVLSTQNRSPKGAVARQLYAQIYTTTAGALRELRLVQDGVENCKLDMTASFVTSSLTIADQDADGTPEVAFAYDLDCGATDAPVARKMIIVEGANKHALRGHARSKDLEGKDVGGDFKPDGFKGEVKLEAWAKARWTELFASTPVGEDP